MSKNSQHPEISLWASVCNSSQLSFTFVFKSSVPFFIGGYLQTSSHQTSKWFQKGRFFFHSWEPGQSVFGLPEWSSKWFIVTWRQMSLMFSSSWWFTGSLNAAFLSLSLCRRLSGTAMSSPREPASAVENLRWVKVMPEFLKCHTVILLYQTLVSILRKTTQCQCHSFSIGKKKQKKHLVLCKGFRPISWNGFMVVI